MYFCKACSREIRFGSETCKQKIDAHEGHAKRQKGLVRLFPERYADAAGTTSQMSQQDAGKAQPAAAACFGVSTQQPLLPLHNLRTSVTLFVHSGQPRVVYAEYEMDPLKGVNFSLEGDSVTVRSPDCKSICGRTGLACKACLDLAKSRNFRKYIAEKAFLIDLVSFCWRRFHNTPVEQEEFKQLLLGRDYVELGLAGTDVGQLVALPCMQLAKKVAAKVNCIPSWRKSQPNETEVEGKLKDTEMERNEGNREEPADDEKGGKHEEGK